MGRRGTYKYICEDCHEENWLSSKDRSSRFKPHCTSCGSMCLEPSHRSRGPEKIAHAIDARKENKDIIDKKMGKNKHN